MLRKYVLCACLLPVMCVNAADATESSHPAPERQVASTAPEPAPVPVDQQVVRQAYAVLLQRLEQQTPRTPRARCRNRARFFHSAPKRAE